MDEPSTKKPRVASPTLATIEEWEEKEESDEIKEVLGGQRKWDFDIFRLGQLTQKRPLYYLGRNLFAKMELPTLLCTEDRILWKWLNKMEELYGDIPYHSSCHSADVLQAVAYFTEKAKPKMVMSKFDEAMLVIAAVIHDLGHPGRTNMSLVAEGHKLALLYNDKSVLENFHVSQAFVATFKDKSMNIFSGMKKDTYVAARKTLIELVLSTDLTSHKQCLEDFKRILQEPATEQGVEEQAVTIVQMTLKAADISNPARKTEISKVWADRICEEFWLQTDEENRLRIRVTNTAFSTRDTDVLPRSQLTFIDMFVRDTFAVWSKYLSLPHLMENIDKNYSHWTNILQDLERKNTSNQSTE